MFNKKLFLWQNSTISSTASKVDLRWNTYLYVLYNTERRQKTYNTHILSVDIKKLIRLETYTTLYYTTLHYSYQKLKRLETEKGQIVLISKRDNESNSP